MTCYAGRIAERLFAPRASRRINCDFDHRTAIDIGMCLETGEALNLYLAWLHKKAEQRLSHPTVWPLVSAVATALVDRRKLTGGEVRAIARAAFLDLVKRQVPY